MIYYLTPIFKEIRNEYLEGKTPELLLDFRNLEYGKVSISAITAFLANIKKLKDFIGQPIPATMNWDPKLQGFLFDIEFFLIAKRFQLFDWRPKEIIGGFSQGNLNPKTKIFYYADIQKISSLTELEIIEKKAILKEKISPNFILRSSNIFIGLDYNIEEILISTSLELIVNSLIHGEEIAFVGVQRSRNRITISVCDSGKGFARSLKKSYPDLNSNKEIDSTQAIIIGSLIQKKMHGLRLAINETLNIQFDEINLNENNGWVTISTYDSEIRWQKKNWLETLDKFDKTNLKNEIPKAEYFLGKKLNRFGSEERILQGYWKTYTEPLIGTRITFEILL